MVGGNSVSYVVKLYPTNNCLLRNGKNVDKFMKNHLLQLHQMIIRTLLEDGFSGVESMNRMFVVVAFFVFLDSPSLFHILLIQNILLHNLIYNST